MIADPPTDLYWIKFESGNLNMYNAGGSLVTVHEFSVLPDSVKVFSFKIDQGSTGIRYRRSSDPVPSSPISWGDPADPPTSVACGGTTEADTVLEIMVTNPAHREVELKTTFTLNLFHPDVPVKNMLLRFDPSIVQKPDEPDV